MRALKPCARCRLILLGWYVLFITGIALLTGLAWLSALMKAGYHTGHQSMLSIFNRLWPAMPIT